MTTPAALYETILEEVSVVLVGNEPLVEHLTVALLTRGHVLFEGVPGIGKTTLANVFARASGLQFSRIQMTPDVLPADVTGTHVYRERTGEFDLQKGPVFANLVVADEINRATPKTQSALLEAMQERTVTIQGETLGLPEPFMVIATQNPIEMEGVFELPEAQRDRFHFKLDVGYPSREEELSILDRFDDRPALGPADVSQVVGIGDVLSAREAVTDVYVADAVKEYVVDLAAATRGDPDVEVGASTRAAITLVNSAKARAAIRDRDYVVPDDVKTLARPVLAHRLVLSTDADLGEVTPGDVIERIFGQVEAPGGELEPDLIERGGRVGRADADQD